MRISIDGLERSSRMVVEDSLVVKEIECECGCGERFVPRRPWQKFMSKKHHDEYWARLYRKAVESMRTANA